MINVNTLGNYETTSDAISDRINAGAYGEASRASTDPADLVEVLQSVSQLPMLDEFFAVIDKSSTPSQ